MKKGLFQFLFACIGFPMLLQAQQPAKKSNCGCSFSSINQVGLLEGSSRSSYQFQTINGLSYGRWFAGIGLGLDRYRFTTVPVFFDIRRQLSKKPNAPFLYGDIGVHLPWVRDKEKTGWWGTDADYNRGLYYDAGVGYNINLGKSRALLFSGGISLKKIRETRNFQVVCVTFPCPEQSENYNFSLKRFSLKAGIRL
jgi:hypothetical protein